MKSKKTIVLASGGIDSTACIHFCKREKITPVPFFINFHQAAAANELKAIKKIIKHYNLKFLSAQYESNIIFKNGEIMGRNAFFLLSTLMTFGNKYDFVTIGLHKGT